MDKLQQLYDLYLSNGLISEAIDLNTFSESTPEQIQKLYDLGKSNGLFEKTDVNVFSSAWDEKKNPNLNGGGTGLEENMESSTETKIEQGSVVSGANPRQLSFIEEQFKLDVPDAQKNYSANKGGVFPTSYKTDEQGGNITVNQELITALNNDPGIIDALQKGKINVSDIQNAASNKKELREKSIKKLKEYRVKSEDEIQEIITNEKLDTPFIYENIKSEDNLIDSIYKNIEGLQGINKADFDGFITSTGLKQDYLDKLNQGIYTNSSNYVMGQKKNRLQTSQEMEELRMLTLYLEEIQKRDRRFQELEYRKRNKGLSMKAEDFDYLPTNYVDPKSLSEFIELNMPTYVQQLKENKVEARALYQKYKDNRTGVGFSLWEASKSFGRGFDDRLNQVTATILDVVGADKAAADIRLAEEYDRLIQDPTLHYTYISGKEVEVGGVNYIVKENGNIFDVDHKANVTGLLDDSTQKIIQNEADKKGVDSSSVSTQGAIIDTSGVLGAIVLDLAMTKGVSVGLTTTGAFAKGAGVLTNTMKTLRSVPISRGMSSAFIAQSSLGYSSGLENTLREAKIAGLSENEAQDLALVAAREMAVLYGLTSFISPQTKATEALFGPINTTTILKEAINKTKQVAGKINPQTFGETIKKIGYKALEYSGEGVKEFIQENVQQAGERFVVNPDINERAGQKIMADTITGEEFVNTSILSFAAGMLIPGAGDLTSGSISLFKDNNIDKLQMLGLLNADKDKALSMMDSQVANGRMTQEQRDDLANQIEVYAGSINFIPRNLNADTASVIMEDVYKISKLENEKEGKSNYFKNKIQKEIDSLNEKIDAAVTFGDLDSATKKQLKEEAKKELEEKNPNKSITEKEILDYAIQKQSAKDVDASEFAEDSPDVGEGVQSEQPTKQGKTKDQTPSETQTEEEVVVEEDLDRDSRLTPEQVKEAQKEEEFTAKQTEGNFFSKFLNNAKRKVKQLFSTRGNLPRNLFKFQEQKQNQANRILFRASRKAAQFSNFFDKLRKTGRISEKELKNLNEDLSKVLKGEMDLKDIKFTNKKGEVKNISNKLGELVVKMRQDIDKMSLEILDAPNIIKKEVPVEIDGIVYKNKIEAQLGKYVSRSYRLFEGALSGAEFRKTLKEDVIEDAKDFFRKDKQFLKEVKTENKKVKEDFETTLERMVDKKINDLLSSSDKETANSFINTYVGGGKKRGILQQRKEVPEPIRKLYGEITDPVANYITTMSKMGSLLSSANFLQSVYENGIGRYLFTKNDPNRPDGMDKISAENNENYGPIDGLYTYPELAEGLFPKNSQQFIFNNKLSDIYLKYFMAFPRAAKTVLSPSTQVINFLSNINFALINGHAPISIMNGTMDMDSYKKSLKAIIATLNNESDEELGKTIELYYELGIIDQSVDVRELRDMLKESTNEEDLLQRFTQEPTYKKQAGNALTRPLKKAFKGASKMYRIGDDFWKIMGYEQESKTLAKVLFDKDINALTDPELKQVQEEAGEMVKNQYPNYSRIPKIGRILKASPVVGNFISFQLESYRTAYNVAFGKQGFASLINRGNEAGKDTPKGKRLRKEGFRKLANMLGYITMRDGAFYAIAKFTGGKLLGGILPMLGAGGFDDDEPKDEEKQTMGGLTVKEQAIREFVYDWQKNSKLIVYQASDGKLKFLDATTFDPFQMIDRLVNGFMQSKTGLDIVKGTFKENFQTFLSLDFVIDAAMKSVENYKRKGSQDVFKDLLQPFFSRAMAPGAVLQIEDAIGKELVSGRNVKEAKPLKLIGYRDYDIDVEKQLYFNLEPERAKQLAKKRSYRGDIYNLIEKLENSQMFTNSDLDDIVKSYKQVNESRKDSWMFVLDQVLSALILGANPENIKRTLQGNKIGFSKKEVDALFNLGFIPLKVNPLAKQKNKSEMEKALQF